MKDVSFGADLDSASLCHAGVSLSRRSLYERRFKRLFDVTFALLVLPFCAPVILIFWAIVHLDGGSGIYRQPRVGQGGRVFDCLKLRTMVPNAEETLRELCARDAQIADEWQQNQKLENDPRITRLGNFLRSTSLDELPQIWNVLRGDMSFVGPRPIMDEQDHAYRAGGGRAYYSMRPGITGRWQIYGRGTTRFADRVLFDEEYAARVTFLGDLKLIVNTVSVIFTQTGQ